MRRGWIIPFLVAAAMATTIVWSTQWLPIVWLFLPGVVLAFLFDRFYFSKKKELSETLLPLYLIALSIQMIHFLEEYFTGFCTKIPLLIGLPEMELTPWISFNMVAYALFILGALILLKKKRKWMVLPLFFIFIGVFLNTIGHLLFSIYAGGYTPGLLSVFAYLFLIPFFVKALFSKPT